MWYFNSRYLRMYNFRLQSADSTARQPRGVKGKRSDGSFNQQLGLFGIPWPAEREGTLRI